MTSCGPTPRPIPPLAARGDDRPAATAPDRCVQLRRHARGHRDRGQDRAGVGPSARCGDARRLSPRRRAQPVSPGRRGARAPIEKRMECVLPCTTSTSSSPCPRDRSPRAPEREGDPPSARQPAVGCNPIVTHGSGQLLTHARTQHRCSCQTAISGGDGHVVFALDESPALSPRSPSGSDAATAVGSPTRLIADARARCCAHRCRLSRQRRAKIHSVAPMQRGSVQSRCAECSLDAAPMPS